MTHKSTWKGRERQAARLFGTERNPGSGAMRDGNRSDSEHERLFIETKLRAKHAAWTVYRKARGLAGGKPVVVVLAEKGKPGLLIAVHSRDYERVVWEFLEVRHGTAAARKMKGKSKSCMDKHIASSVRP